MRPDVRNFLTSGNGCFQSPSFPDHVTKKQQALGTRMGKPVSSTHVYFVFYHHVGLFNQWKGVRIVCFHAGAFKSKKMSCKACVFTRRRFFLLQFPVFFLPRSTKSIPYVGKWCVSQLSFDLPVLSPLFAYLNKDRSPSIMLWYSFISILKRQVVFVFICLKIFTFLFADTYSLQSNANCMALKRTTSAKSLHDKQLANFNLGFRFRNCSMKIL